MGEDSMSVSSDDDADAPVGGTSAPLESQRGKLAYSDAANRSLARPLWDFVPSRLTMIAATVFGGVAIAAVLVLVHAWSGSIAGFVGDPDFGLFELGASGSIDGWFAAMLLVAAGLVAMFIYSLRRHRVDDYYGRYRVWIWTAIACLVVSLAETSGTGDVARALCRRVAAWSGASEGVVWPAAMGMLLAVAAARLLLEVRRCRWGVALLAASAGCFLAAAAARHDWLIHIADADRPLVGRGSWLVGYVAMLATFLIYARFVTLEIEGKIAVVAAQPKPRKAKRPAPADREETRVDSPRKAAPSVRTDLDSGPAASFMVSKPSPSTASNGNGQGHPSLSRAERRRLRREARMQS